MNTQFQALLRVRMGRTTEEFLWVTLVTRRSTRVPTRRMVKVVLCNHCARCVTMPSHSRVSDVHCSLVGNVDVKVDTRLTARGSASS